MSLRLTLSYQSEHEAQAVLDVLRFDIPRLKVSKRYDGERYMRKYVFFSDEDIARLRGVCYNNVEHTYDE